MSQAGEISSTTGPVPPIVPTSFVENSGTAVPSGNVLNVPGNNTANNGFATWTIGSGSTLQINSYGTAKWVVNPIAGVGTHTTIQSAVTAASAGDTVFITANASPYTENVTLKSGVNLVAFTADAYGSNVTILGKLSYSGAGNVSISGIDIQTNGDYGLSVTGSSASVLNLVDCTLNAANNTWLNFTSSNAAATLNFYQCNGEIGTTGITYFNSSSAGTINVEYCFLDNAANSTTANTISSGGINLHHTKMNVPTVLSGTATGAARFCRFLVPNATCFTTSSSNNYTIIFCYLQSGTASAVSCSTTITMQDCVISSSNTNVIIGSGTLSYVGLAFVSTSYGINITTVTPSIFNTGAVPVTTPAAYPYTTKGSDYVILVDTTASARTINLIPSPVTGQTYRIKDANGSAGSHNITVTPAAGNIDGGASYVMNVNYGSIDVVYSGTQWQIL